MLFPPKNPNFDVEVSEKDFSRVDLPEDELLLATGEWDEPEPDERKRALGDALKEVQALRRDIAKK